MHQKLLLLSRSILRCGGPTGVLGSLRAAAAQLVRVASASGDVLPSLLMAAKDDLGMAPVGPATLLLMICWSQQLGMCFLARRRRG